MKIENRTRYSTAALRWLVRRTIRNIGRAEGKRLLPWQLRNLKIDVVPSRYRHSGRATLGGAWAIIRIPNPGPTPMQRRFIKRHPETAIHYELTRSPVRTKDIASLVQHELYHTFGYDDRRRQYGRGRPDNSAVEGPDVSGQDYEWAVKMLGETFPLEPSPKKVTAEERKQTRYSRVLARIARWMQIKKRADTALRKLAQKKRYYERTLAVAAKPGEPDAQ